MKVLSSREFNQDVSQAKRAELKQSKPELSFTEIAGELGKMWRELGDEKKKVYSDQYDAAMVEYEKKMQEYQPPADLDSDAEEAGKSPRKKAKKRKKRAKKKAKEEL